MGYSSNILYKQPFSSREDIFVSFLIQNPATEIFFSDLLLQIGDKMLLQDESYLQLNFPLTYKGFGVFLVDSNVPLLTGGGSKGLGIITDENTTSLSAVSGFFLCSMYDLEGSFGALSGVNQFKTGTPTHQANSIVVRKLSSFEFMMRNMQDDELQKLVAHKRFIIREFISQELSTTIYHLFAFDLTRCKLTWILITT